MNKRTDAIRSMFAIGDTLSADNKGAPARVPAGSVRSVQNTFSDIERENEDLRAQLSGAPGLLELDPSLIDSSPLADRFVEQDTATFEVLKTSIAEKGQLIPVLVRPNPKAPGRYQSAFGHRRIRAARDLGLKVKAHLREMSDEDLVVAQGVENSAREDLSFIERSMFALQLEGAGFSRSVVQTALSIDRAEASKLLSVAKAIPVDIAAAIGRAPKVGRARWQSLADLLKEEAALARVRSLMKEGRFAALSTDARFGAAVTEADPHPDTQRADVVGTLQTRERRSIGHFSQTGSRVNITLIKEEKAFGEFLIDQIPDLFAAYAKKRKSGSPRD